MPHIDEQSISRQRTEVEYPKQSMHKSCHRKEDGLLKLLKEVNDEPREGGKHQTRLGFEKYVIGLGLYSKSGEKPLMLLSRIQHAEICYEVFSLA